MTPRRFIFAVIFISGLAAGASPAVSQTSGNVPAGSTPPPSAVEKTENTLDALIPGLLLTPEERLNYKPEEQDKAWVFPSGRYHRESYDEETLFRMYQEGEYNRILYSLLRYARQGNARAEETIGLMYRFGQGVKRDNEQALRWFSRAAEDQLPLAQHHMGALYFEGTGGITRDMIKSAMWLELAVENYPDGANKDRAVSDLENVKLRLSRLEQIQASDLANRYRQRFPKPASAAAGTPAPDDTPAAVVQP